MEKFGISLEILPGKLAQTHARMTDLVVSLQPIRRLREGLMGSPAPDGVDPGLQLFYRSRFDIVKEDLRTQVSGHVMGRVSSFAAAAREMATADTDAAIESVIVVAPPDIEATLSFAYEAIMPAGSTPELYFVSGIGPLAERLVAAHEPSRTLVVIVSRTLEEPEIVANLAFFRQWIADRLGDKGLSRRLCAVTENDTAARMWGISASQIFPFPEAIEADTALFSPLCLPIEICTPARTFEKLRAGASEIDAFVFNTPAAENPIIQAAALDLAMLVEYGETSVSHIALCDRMVGYGSWLRTCYERTFESLGAPLVVDNSAQSTDAYVATLRNYMLADVVVPSEAQDVTSDRFAILEYRAQTISTSLRSRAHPACITRHNRITPKLLGALSAIVEYRHTIVRMVLASRTNHGETSVETKAVGCSLVDAVSTL